MNSAKIQPSSQFNRLGFLDDMRAIAIIMIVGVHVLAYCVELPQHQKEIISFIVHSISVPIFFLVDGYLFSRSTTYKKSYNYIKYIRKSFFRLLIPWIIFTLLYALSRYVFELTGFLEEKIIVGASFQDVFISAYGSVYAPQLYFLFSLFLIRLCTPIIKKVTDVESNFTLLLIFLLYFIAYKLLIPFVSPYLEIAGGQEPILHALWGFQFYLLGVVLFKISGSLNLKKLFVPFLLFFIFALYLQGSIGGYGAGLVQYLYLVVFVLFFMFFYNGWLPLNFLGKNTMGIYLLHAPIVLKAVSLVLNKYIHTPIISYFSILVVTLLITIFIVRAVKLVPYGSLLFGSPYDKKIRAG